MSIDEVDLKGMIDRTEDIIDKIDRNSGLLYEALTTEMFYEGNEVTEKDKDTVMDISGLHGHTQQIKNELVKYKKKLNKMLDYIHDK